VITGASTGIGAETARQAAAEGALVAIAARRPAELDAVAADCLGSLAVVADVTRREDVERLAAATIQKYGHFDVWINNVGMGISHPPMQLTSADVDHMMDVNVKSALHGMQVAAAHFMARGRGQVINISSELGRVPSRVERAAYSGSKHFLNALTAGFRDEVAATHPDVLFTTVSPGLVYTEFGLNALHGGIDSRALRGKAPGQEPDAVASVVLHAIRMRAVDLYTAPGAKQRMLDYLEGLAQDPPVEAQKPSIRPSSVVRRVLIVVAMEQEVMPIVERFGMQRVSAFLPSAPFVAWERAGVAGLERLHVVWVGRDERFGGVNNVATTAAAVAAYAAIAAFGAPDLVVSAGTAGGFACVGASVGDVYLSSKCVFHSRRIPGSEGSLEEYGFGHFRSPPLPALAAAIGVKVGVVSTSDSLDSVPMDLHLMRSEGAAVKEMEAAAVAWVCQALAVPFVAVKSITDIVDGPHATRSEFESNLASASDALQQKMALLLSTIAGSSLQRWAPGANAPPPSLPPPSLPPAPKSGGWGGGTGMSTVLVGAGAVLGALLVMTARR